MNRLMDADPITIEDKPLTEAEDFARLDQADRDASQARSDWHEWKPISTQAVEAAELEAMRVFVEVAARINSGEYTTGTLNRVRASKFGDRFKLYIPAAAGRIGRTIEHNQTILEGFGLNVELLAPTPSPVGTPGTEQSPVTPSR